MPDVGFSSHNPYDDHTSAFSFKEEKQEQIVFFALSLVYSTQTTQHVAQAKPGPSTVQDANGKHALVPCPSVAARPSASPTQRFSIASPHPRLAPSAHPLLIGASFHAP